MITQQTVDQLATKFVQDVISYHNTKKYVVNTDITCVYDSLFNYLSGINLLSTNCEDYELECELVNSITGDYVYTPPVQEIPCNDQLTVTFNRSTVTCNNTTEIKNSFDDGTRPDNYLVDNSKYIETKINLHKNICNVKTETVIQGGCTIAGCSNAYKASFRHVWVNNNLVLSPQGYISEMLIYETDSMGEMVNTPIIIDLEPSTSPYYTGAGLTTLVLNDVRFNNVNWTSNMATLLNNISIYRYGQPNRHNITFNKVLQNGTFKRISAWVENVHKPSNIIFGLNRLNGYIKINDVPNTEALIINQTNISNSYNPVQFYNSSTVSTSCGNLTPLVSGSVNANINTSLTTFNKIVLAGPVTTGSVTLSGTNSLTCTTNTITAIYNASNVLSVEWRNPSNVVISTTPTCSLTTYGTYTFRATLLNGCVITRTAQHPPELLEVE